MSRMERIQDESAVEWKGFRLPQRQRLAWACEHLITKGELNRRHIAEAFECSLVQAANDLRTIVDRAPWLMEYDKVAKTYRPKVKA